MEGFNGAMPSYLGVDWAGSCWVVVRAGAEPLVTTEPSILNVWHEHGQDPDVESILVDIPIGLPKSGTRACDRQATAHLANRGNTVFPIPARPVVETDDYTEARELNGGTLGSQAWWLFPRIREVDCFLQAHPDAGQKLYESHPEVCFATLAGEPLPAKDTEAGRTQRLALLSDQPKLHERIEEVVDARANGTAWHDRISAGRRDDVIDAAGLAYTATQLELGPRDRDQTYPRLPAKPARDPVLDLPMEIVHPNAG